MLGTKHMYVVKTTFVVMINSSFIFSYYLQNIHHEAKKRQYFWMFTTLNISCGHQMVVMSTKNAIINS